VKTHGILRNKDALEISCLPGFLNQSDVLVNGIGRYAVELNPGAGLGGFPMKTPISLILGVHQDAVARFEADLKDEGFGVLCKVDIRAKFKEKLGVEFPRYVILGACNPPLAYQALQEEIDLGLLLPCNTVVYERDGQVYVGAVDAAKMLSAVGNPAMEPMARDVNERLHRVVEGVKGTASA